MRRIVVGLLMALAIDARATTFATDMTDLWWNSSEGGWGVNVNHQDDTLFLTFFLYGPNRAPIWYTASNVRYVTSPPTQITYSGELTQSSGPWFGGPYDERTVTARTVGTATFLVNSPNVATLTYTVDGVTVSKTITRYTFKVNNMSAIYRGVMAGAQFNCTVSASNGPLDTYLTSVNVNHTGSTFGMQTVDTNGVNCLYSGGYSQTGKLGVINGSFSCTNGRTGPFQAAEVEANTRGFHAAMSYSYPGCSWAGNIAAARS
jgi:hypothetical protein